MQAGWEQGISNVMAGLSGLNMVYESVGMHASLLGFCHESLILGDDMLGQCLRCVRGIDVTDDTLSLDVMKSVCLEGPGHYLGHDQTLDVMQSHYVYPSLGDRTSPKEWVEIGRPDLVARATEPVWKDIHSTKRGLAPYYNPLDPRVQDAVLTVVRTLAERYGAHRSFGGVCLQIGPETFLQFPDERWGQDPATLARFRREVGERSTPAEVRQQWLLWRSRELAEFYVRIQRELGRANPQARLYLAGADLIAGDPVRSEMSPRLLGKPDFSEAMLRHGFDPARFDKESGIVLMRPHRAAPVVSLAGRSVDLQVNQSSAVDQFFAGAAGGGSPHLASAPDSAIGRFRVGEPLRAR